MFVHTKYTSVISLECYLHDAIDPNMLVPTYMYISLICNQHGITWHDDVFMTSMMVLPWQPMTTDCLHMPSWCHNGKGTPHTLWTLLLGGTNTLKYYKTQLDITVLAHSIYQTKCTPFYNVIQLQSYKKSRG